MSVELYGQHFQHGALIGVPSAEVAHRLGVVPSATAVDLIIDGQTMPCSFALDPAGVSGFTIQRPITHREFWRRIASLVHDLGFVVYLPGSAAHVAAASQGRQHLPDDLIEALGVVELHPEDDLAWSILE